MSTRSENNDDGKRLSEGVRLSLLDRLRTLLGLAPASVRESGCVLMILRVRRRVAHS